MSPVQLAPPASAAAPARRRPADPPAAPPAPCRGRELSARLLAHGVEALDDGDCLELLLGLPPAAADALLAGFGSVPEVLGAAPADLARAVGPLRAARLKAAQALAARMLLRPLRRRSVLGSLSAVAAHLRTTLAGAPREQVRALFLDRRNRLIAEERLWDGTVDHAPVYPREVVRRALELNASALILAHNHPGGQPDPSAADVETTRQLVAAGRALGVAVHDHLIVAGETVVSLQALGLL
jgi:DNA repair protein RadC